MATPAHTSRRYLNPGDKLGKHEVLRHIAVGGMTELYLTRTVGAEGLEKLVCVKRLLAHYTGNPRFVTMFLGEARLASTLHHPNIAQIYDAGQEPGDFFFSMEYVHGEDLGRLVAASREHGVPISLDGALTIAAGLCAGLHYAHEKTAPDGKPLGIVHRDVSPSNVLVSYDGAVKLVDFGLGRAHGDPRASQTGLGNKIPYMSPEQIRRQAALDRRSDVFSVGAILYELTTGRRPFVDRDERGVLQQILERDADPPSAGQPGYPPALEAIVMRALARDPERRFPTALALQNQIEEFAHDHRLRVSPLVLARLMSTLFPARLEQWDHARAQGAFFVEQHVMRTLIESGKTADGAPHVAPEPVAIDETFGAWSGALDAAWDVAAPEVMPAERTQPGPSPAAATAPVSPDAAARASGATVVPGRLEPDGPPRRPNAPSSPTLRPGSGTLPPPVARPSSPAPLAGARAKSSTLPPTDARSTPVPRSALPGLPPVPAPESRSAPSPKRAPSTPPTGSRTSSSKIALPGVPQINPRAASSSSGSGPSRPNASPQPTAEPAGRSSQPAPVAPQLAPEPAGRSTHPPPEPAGRSTHPPPMASVSQPLALTPPSSLAAWAPPPTPAQAPPSHGSVVPMPAPPALTEPAASGPLRTPYALGDVQLASAWGGVAPPPDALSRPALTMLPMSAPPIPSGGTLVSSATVAGTPPPPVRPVQGPYGATGGLDGLAGRSNHVIAAAATGGAARWSTPMPGAAPAEPPSRNQRGDATEHVRGAPPARQPGGGARAPYFALAAVGVAGIAVAAWLILGRDPGAVAPGAAAGPSDGQRDGMTNGTGARSNPALGKQPVRAVNAVPELPSAPETTNSDASEATAATAADPVPSETPASDTTDDSAAMRQAAGTDARAGNSEPTKKPKLSPDPRAKTKVKRAPKTQKEKPWSDDSPFMPVATPKH